jgi:hypothetical protein
LRVRPKIAAPRLGVPVRRAEADEGRHEINLLGGSAFCASALTSEDFTDELQAVAQPLHRGAGDEDRALQRIGAPAAELIGDGGEQRWRDRTGSEPVLSSAKQPVP